MQWVKTYYREKRDQLRKGLEEKGIPVEEVRLSGWGYCRYAFPRDG
jgi:hypothetical protein